MFLNLEKTFDKIGAKVRVVFVGDRRVFGNRSSEQPPARLNVITKKRKEMFEIAIQQAVAERLDLSVLEVLPKERHLVLLAKLLDASGNVVTKNHFLCGHDERHLFVASVEAVSTVAAAKEALKPEEIVRQEIGLNTKKRNRRKTEAFKRQGEWFFIPSDITPVSSLILRNEPLLRDRRSKPHTAQFAYRTGGESVVVCHKYPNGLLQHEYEELLERDSKAKQFSWRHMRRNASVYVSGRITHADHATILLESWHRVLINTERRSEAVAFLD